MKKFFRFFFTIILCNILISPFNIYGDIITVPIKTVQGNNNINIVQSDTNVINIKYPKSPLIGAKGDGKADDTKAIQAIINSCHWGDTIYFPKGDYIVSGLSIPTAINITGYSKTSAIIKNISTVNPCIKIIKTKERIRIHDIGIFGNGTTKYGTNATSSYGIMLDGCNLINIDNIWMRDHGNHAIFATNTNVNNINISNSEIEWNKGDAINIIEDSIFCQKNAIYINNCNIAANSGNGISIWGNSISVSQNTIQGNKGLGVSIDSDFVKNECDSSGIAITENYFEACSKGFLKIKANKDNGIIKRIIGIKLIGNFGHLFASQVDGNIKSIVNIENPSSFPTNSLIRDFQFDNSFASDTLYVLNTNNCLTADSTIKIPSLSDQFFINLGAAKIDYYKTTVINGYFYAKGVDYNISTGKSNNITTNATIYFPCNMGSFNNLRSFGVICETDSTNYSIKIELMKRDKNTTKVYISNLIGQINNVNGTKVFSPNQKLINISTNNTNIDMYFKITIKFRTTGKYFYLGNPTIETTQ